MKCRDFEELLSAYADGELAQTQQDFIEQHLAGCIDCQAKLARYQNTGKQLVSLNTTSRTPDIKEATMSRIKSEPWQRNRRWLWPAIAGTAAVAIISILTAVFILPSQSPEDALAQALANTQELKTYRLSKTMEVRLPETIEWITYAYAEDDFAGPNLHIKSRIDVDYKDGVLDHWIDREFIISDNIVYLWKLTSPLPFSLEVENQLWSETTSMIEQPMDDFRLLADIKRMPNEKIDGIVCLHYKGLVDMDAWIENQLTNSEPLARDRHERWHKALGEELTDEDWAEQWAAQTKQIEINWRIRQIELEYWIGKDDNLLHQFSYFDTASPQAKEIISLSEDHRETAKYSDFNQEIIITPPLDNQGNLLPDWKIQSAP